MIIKVRLWQWPTRRSWHGRLTAIVMVVEDMHQGHLRGDVVDKVGAMKRGWIAHELVHASCGGRSTPRVERRAMVEVANLEGHGRIVGVSHGIGGSRKIFVGYVGEDGQSACRTSVGGGESVELVDGTTINAVDEDLVEVGLVLGETVEFDSDREVAAGGGGDGGCGGGGGQPGLGGGILDDDAGCSRHVRAELDLGLGCGNSADDRGVS